MTFILVAVSSNWLIQLGSWWLIQLGSNKVYRSMQLIDGKLYPPMAEIVDRKRQEATEIGKWYVSDERPDLAYEKKKGSGRWFFRLKKTAGKSPVPARYNPYWHTTSSSLNDQFSLAYKRDNLVVVEVEIPKSELTSGYKADKAKDSVGEMDWHSGPVSQKLAELGDKRTVILSRYNKVIRILDDSEVAHAIADKLSGTGIVVPDKVVSPKLLKELQKLGVDIQETQEVADYRISKEEGSRYRKNVDTAYTYSQGIKLTKPTNLIKPTMPTKPTKPTSRTKRLLMGY